MIRDTVCPEIYTAEEIQDAVEKITEASESHEQAGLDPDGIIIFPIRYLRIANYALDNFLRQEVDTDAA